jgi:hypothetical protein
VLVGTGRLRRVALVCFTHHKISYSVDRQPYDGPMGKKSWLVAWIGKTDHEAAEGTHE